MLCTCAVTFNSTSTRISVFFFFFFSSRRRHTRCSRDWSSDVCSSDLAVHPAVPVNSIQELVAYARANPGKINFASPGYGTQPHLLGEMLKRLTGINIVHVPYKGPAQAMTELLAGQVQMYFETVAFFLPHVRAGKVKALAVADETRSPHLASVPTTVESGFPELQGTFWLGVLAPPGTPASIVVKRSEERRVGKEGRFRWSPIH